ncbi:MAG: hypothetical protein RRZ64_00130 [Rikenellaceae bacterium]
MAFWIARDKDGEVFLYTRKPVRFNEDGGYFDAPCNPFKKLEKDSFHTVTWENSPKEVELKLIEE